MGIVAVLALLCALTLIMASGLSAQGRDVEAVWRQMFKRSATAPPSPPNNPLNADKIALGARLFADARLSGGSDRTCASCHKLERAFTDGRRRALALSGAPLRRNTPSLWNLAWGKHFFWDGRAPSLETQVGMPIAEPQEMGGDWRTILLRLEGDEALVRQFRAAFPESPAVSRDTILMALASYVRSLVSPPTRFDAWINGDTQALRPAEVRGFGLFVGKAGCVLCHVGWRFTDDRFHDIGLRSPMTVAGRWRAARRGSGHSRRRVCASLRTPRLTCTTARWRRWKPSSSIMLAASLRGRGWRRTSTVGCGWARKRRPT
jgi:cytochrome c peroxidase